MTETEAGYQRDSARRGAANMAPVLMILSFVLMVAFLAWLGLTAEGTDQVAMAEEEPTRELADSVELAAMQVTPDELRLNPGDYTGQAVRVAAPVASAVGSQAFFLDLPQSPFLVKMDSAMVAAGRQLPQGDVTVTGTVMEMNDSIVTSWSEAGLISDADRPLVEFATHFINASRVRGTPGARSQAAPAGGEQAGGGEQGGTGQTGN